MKKHNSLIVLKALLNGISIKIETGHTICMSEDNKLCYEMLVEQFPSELKLFQADWDFNGFIKFCENMPEQEICNIAASLALSKHVE
jgi:hypothetical protein